jgi:hypothetical protein
MRPDQSWRSHLDAWVVRLRMRGASQVTLRTRNRVGDEGVLDLHLRYSREELDSPVPT